MRSVISILFAVSISSAWATCPEVLDKIVSTNKVYWPLTPREIKGFDRAISHHQDLIRTSSRQTKAFYYLQGNSVTGYEFWIRGTEPGTEVSYVLDAKRKLVLAHWKNIQNDLVLWFCGGNEEIAIELAKP